MSDFCRLSKMILRMTWPLRHYDRSELARLLAQHCPDEGALAGVESAVLLNLSVGPATVLCLNDSGPGVSALPDPASGRWTPVLPGPALAELVAATRTEVFRLLRGVCEEIASVALRFEARTLYVRGREVAKWKNQEADSRYQIDILTAFQEANWDSPIPNPLPTKEDYDDLNQVLRNLNRKVRNWLHFSQRDGRLFWSWATHRHRIDS